MIIYSSVVLAKEYGNYEPKRILKVSETSSGKKYGLDLKYLDRILKDLSFHAKNYPPRFDSTQDKQRAIQDIRVLSGMLDLDILVNDPNPNPQILWRAGSLSSMGHNLDIPGSTEKASEIFLKLLTISPHDPRGNYDYGVFLAGSGRSKKAIPYLEKAHSLGVSNASYSLGMVYLSLGDKQKAIENLELYKKRKPNDRNIDKLLNGIINGKTVIKRKGKSKSYSAKSPDWYKYYYLNPNPQKFVEETKKMSKSGVLLNPKTDLAAITFLSQVMAQNPNKIINWLNQLNELTEKEMAPIYKAAWLSNTKEAIRYFERNKITKYKNRRPPNPLDIELKHPAHLDMLWSYFFATGEKQPIRKIVTALNYYKYKGAIDAFKSSKQTSEDRQKAIYEAMYKAAIWSLEANSKQHKKIKKIIEEIYNNSRLTKNERLWLVYVLNRLDPNKYKNKVKKNNNKNAV